MAEVGIAMQTQTFHLHCNPTWMRGNFGLKLQNSPKLPHIHARFYIAQNSATHTGLFLSLVALNLKSRESKDEKMAENGATSTAPCLFTYSTAHVSIRYTLGLLKKRYQVFILNIFLSR